MSDVDDVLALWRAAEDAFNRGDVDAQLRDAHEGIVLHSVAAGGFSDGRDTAAASQAAVRARFETARFTTTSVRGRSFGVAVVLWGDCEFEVTPASGEAMTIQARFTSTWADTGSGWVDICNHYSPA